MEQIILITISALIISIVSAYLGTLMLQREAVLTAGPLGHLAIPGAALALIYGFDISLGAFPFILLGGVIIWYLEKNTSLKTESITAVVFATTVAIGFLFLPMDKAEAVLIGNITHINWFQTAVTFVSFLIIAIILKTIFKKMLLITISEDLAKVERIKVSTYKFIYFLLIALTVAFGMRLVGGLLTAALVSIPPASAKNITNRLSAYIFLSIAFGGLSTLLGIVAFVLTNLPLGPLIIIFDSLIFTFSLFFVKRNYDA